MMWPFNKTPTHQGNLDNVEADLKKELRQVAREDRVPKPLEPTKDECLGTLAGSRPIFREEINFFNLRAGLPPLNNAECDNVAPGQTLYAYIKYERYAKEMEWIK